MENKPKNNEFIYLYDGYQPDLASKVFIAPGAKIVGRVTLKNNVSIWFNSVLRGDVGSINIEEGTNVQDGTVIHVSRSKNGDTYIGKYVTIGHKAIIHACCLEDESFIGMGAIIMDGAIVEKKSMVAAGSVVSPNKVVREGELWAGIPSKFIRKLNSNEIKNNLETAIHYVKLSKEYNNINMNI
ncbi:MAG: Carnitine operon protein CaiE [Alphaproteobacteria bacterium MarineAlpha2_Bin1]|nr:MAG: Carnitine operon protein CaiE [Alphaproteobacteria bacterium MarineAlpha2_Bin1]